jgi:hypothetical protein
VITLTITVSTTPEAPPVKKQRESLRDWLRRVVRKEADKGKNVD